jgi:hypothetical protein
MFSRFFVAIACVSLLSCSSSNSGPAKPKKIQDNQGPVALQVFPDSNDVFLSTLSTIVFQFDEQLNTSGNYLDDGVKLKVADSLLLNITGDEESSIQGAVLRDRRFTAREETYVRSAFDEISSLEKEITATALFISPTTSARFSLNTAYLLTLGAPLRDLSDIQSINPISGEKENGNFLQEIEYEFVTRDGAWTSSESLLSTLSLIGEPKFVSNTTDSFVIFKALRTIPDTTSTLIGLYGLRYDNVLEVWDSNAFVIDDYPISDNASYDPNSEGFNDYFDSDRGDVSEFDVSVSGNNIIVAFLQEPDSGAPSRVFVRLFDEVWKARLMVGDNESSDRLKNMQLAPADVGVYVTWLNEGGGSTEKQVNFDVLMFSEQQETGLISLTKTFGDFNLPSELSNVSNNTENVKVTKLVNANTLLVSHTEIAGEARLLSFKADADLLSFKEDIERYNLELKNCDDQQDDGKKVKCKNALIEPEFSWTSEELTVPGIPIQAEFSLSINESSEGFIAWKQMDTSVFNVYTRRFDGNRWGTSELMEFDDRGDVGFLDLEVTSDGHAILAWSSDNGDGSFSLQARAYVFDDNERARNFAASRLLSASLRDTVTRGFLVTDNEGNANLAVLLQNDSFLNYRYRDNKLTSQAWDEQDPVTSNFQTKTAMFLENIAEDGRMALLWTEITNGNFVLQSSIFKEEANN